ncbi:MAG: hydrogenase maturation protease [Sulfuricaulis sp.]|uniref:hydrogenase maturation protease n=1 Tax=Sulfuricaulis sp. TaxID=2003553 RepID=UPI003C435784
MVAAEALQRSSVVKAVESGQIVISILERPGTMLLAHWHDAGIVIVIDAVCSGALPGTCFRFDAGKWAVSGLPASSHGFGVAAALELAHALGDLPSRHLVRGVEIEPSCSGFGLSRAVARVLPAFVREIEAETPQLAKTGLPGMSRAS